MTHATGESTGLTPWLRPVRVPLGQWVIRSVAQDQNLNCHTPLS